MRAHFPGDDFAVNEVRFVVAAMVMAVVGSGAGCGGGGSSGRFFLGDMPQGNGDMAMSAKDGSAGIAPECQQYIDCAAAVAPGTLPQLLTAYGPGGMCWTSTAEVAAACRTACQTGFAQLAMSHPAEPKCGGDPVLAFCPNTGVAKTCAQKFLAQIDACFHPSGACYYAMGSPELMCFSSGEMFSIVAAGDQRAMQWKAKDGSICATGTKSYADPNDRTLIIVKNGQTFTYGYDSGMVICPDGSAAQLQPLGTDCQEAAAILTPSDPNVRMECSGPAGLCK